MMFKLFLIFATTIAAGWCQSDERSRTVSFLVVDESGKTLSGWRVSSFKSRDSEIASKFTGLTGTQIPTGSYQYLLTAPPVRVQWTPTLSGQVWISRPEKFIVLTAAPDVLNGISNDRAQPFSFVIRGRIEPMPAHSENSDPVRIHIHPMTQWPDFDVRVDPSGDFRIYESLSGICVLTVIRGAEVLHVEPVFFAQDFHSAAFVMKIGDKPPSVMRVQ